MSTVHGGQGNIIKNGLVLWLDAANPRSYDYPYTGTTWRDLSGNGNNGTLINGPLYNSSNGGNIVFDGIDDYAITTIQNGFTKELSVITVAKSNVSNWNSWAGLGSARVGNGYIIHNDPGSRQVLFYLLNAGGGFTLLGSTTPPNIMQYHFYAMTTNGLNSHQMYFNNTLFSQSTTSITRTNSNTSQDNYLGFDFPNAGRYNNISIMYHLIYNRALSQQEVLQNYNATRARFGV